MQFDSLIETLYSRHYFNGPASLKFSQETSSHWREFGKKTNVIKVKKPGEVIDYEIKAYGISGFKKNTLLNRLINTPSCYLLPKILSQYNANPETTRCAIEISKKLNILFNFDHVKHILIFDLLDKYGAFDSENLICIIGDGHGFFGTLIKSIRPNAKIMFVNLGRNLTIDSVCFSKIHSEVNPLLIDDAEDIKEISSHSVIFLEAERYKMMKNLKIGLFVNIASMQEMDESMIEAYFDIMQTSSAKPYFYCCNREEKILPDGNIIRFIDYPWFGDLLIDEPCPWYEKYPSNRPPFWKKFDGTHLHRLIKIN